MERFSYRENSYIPFERRKLLEHLEQTVGEPVLAVIPDSNGDVFATAGINAGLTGNSELLIANNDTERARDIDEFGYIAGVNEIYLYVASQLDEWRLNPDDISRLTHTIGVVDAAVTYDCVPEPEDPAKLLEELLAATLRAVPCSIESESADNLVATVRSSRLAEQFNDLMREYVRTARSLSELYAHPILVAYVRSHLSGEENVQNELAILANLASPLETEG